MRKESAFASTGLGPELMVRIVPILTARILPFYILRVKTRALVVKGSCYETLFSTHSGGSFVWFGSHSRSHCRRRWKPASYVKRLQNPCANHAWRFNHLSRCVC